MLDQIEKTLNGELVTNFEGFDVESFPAKFDEYNFTSHNGCLLIRYDGSSFSNQNTLLAANQSETYNYSIIMGLRYENFKACYKWIKQLKNTLLGFTVCGYRIVLKQIKFLDEINSDLWWGVSFSLVQEVTDENNKDYWWEDREKILDRLVQPIINNI